MTFFAVLFALLVEQLKPLPRATRLRASALGWVDWTARNLDAGRPHHAAVVWCVAVPVIDTLQVMYNRLRDGRSIFDSDRLHMHYRLVDMGFSTRRTVAVMLAGNATVVGLGLALTTLSPALSLVVFVAAGAVYGNWNAIRIQAARVTNVRHSRRRFDSL